mmetsp:Transcript_25635/g.27538  ORF Transcript_25635/g.27538 Transcript_25635/m.27538 type:complete len:176 (-) Transcript_25635:213-740(-)
MISINCYFQSICLLVIVITSCAPLQLLDAFCLVHYPTRKCSYIKCNSRFNKLITMQNNSEQMEQRKQQEERPIPTDPFQATGQDELFKTLAGGPALIFEMARKSILFSDANKPTTTTTKTTSKKSKTLSFETHQPPPSQQQQQQLAPPQPQQQQQPETVSDGTISSTTTGAKIDV